MIFRFTLSHDTLGNEQINEPGGWDTAKIILERDLNWYSLLENYEGLGDNGAFMFYGEDSVNNGGLNFIERVEQNYGPDSRIGIDIDFAIDNETYSNLFNGILKIYEKKRRDKNQIDVPVIQEDFWSKFTNRLNTSVNLSSTTDIDGNAVSEVPKIDAELIGQYIRMKYEGHNEYAATTQYTINDNQYGIIDFFDEPLSEIKEKYTLPRVSSTDLPDELFAIEYGGKYHFDIQIYTAVGTILSNATVAALEVRLQINDNTPIVLNQFGEGTAGLDERMRHYYDNTLQLEKGDLIRLYFYNNNAPGASYTFDWWANLFQDSYLKITADTLHPDSTAQGYLLHDAIYGVLQRIGLGNTPFYSEFLGSTLTNCRTYAADGCGWAYGLFKGLQIRQYALDDKPFFTSFKQLWDGINPILNLCLYKDNINGVDVIRIEQKSDQFDQSSTSVDFNNISELPCEYDHQHIFKTIKTGYKQWQSENVSGIDDPQAKQERSTQLKYAGTDILLESEFIAASLAIETTRRSVKEKSADHKFDDKIFIIALNDNDASPDSYYPELDENFDSVTGLLNSERRYNLTLTPMRNFLRWANVFNGCLFQYQNTSYKFGSGEGNYDMQSDYSCTNGRQCIGIICDNLREGQDIALSPAYYGTLGYLFIPEEFTFTTELEWEDFQTIRDNPHLAIGVSQGFTNHAKFFIKKLEYSIVEGRATITAWPKIPFRTSVPESLTSDPTC